MKNVLYLLLFAAALFVSSCKSENKSNSSVEQLDDYSALIDSIIQTTNPRIFNGVVRITQNGKEKYSKAYGFSNFEEKTPIQIDDKFRIQSNSKQITAVLILKEVESGNIDLQKPVKEYLPNFNQSWADSVTVHQLLNMSSGIVDLNKPLIFKPGDDYTYSNPGYGLLGRIIEDVSGKRFATEANNLFNELGMNSTYCYELGDERTGLVNGYWLLNDEIDLAEFDIDDFTNREWDDFVPAGGVISNVYDLNVWDSKLHNGQILKPEHYKLMTTASNEGPHAAFNGETVGYGYGLRIGDNPVTHIGHGGRGFGFVSIKFYIPETDVDVIIWENIYSRDPNFMAGDMVYHFENEIRKIVVNSILGKR